MNSIYFVIIAVLLRVISNPLANVFQKQLTGKGQHPMLVNFLTYFLLTIACGYWIMTINWASLPPAFWIYSIAGGMVGALGNALLIKALQTGELSVLGPINAYKAVVAMILGIFMLGEFPSLWGLLGAGLIIYGSYFVLDTADEKFSPALLKKEAIRYRIGAMILSAIEAIFVKKVILASDPGIAFVSWCVSGALFSFVLLFIFSVPMRFRLGNARNTWFFYLLLICCIGTMQGTTNYVFAQIPVGYALSFFQLSTIVSVLLGYHVFREADMVKKLIGSVIMIAGSLILIWLNK